MSDEKKPRLSTDSEQRKEIPLASGCLDYFPDALAAVAANSHAGNQKHNPGKPLHWYRGKSSDHADCLLRHLVERGTVDTDGIRHSVKVAWRALALLQEELEGELGLPVSRGSRAAALPPTVQGESEILPRVVTVGDLRIGDRIRVAYGVMDPFEVMVTEVEVGWAHASGGAYSFEEAYPGKRTITLLERRVRGEK